MAPAFVNQTLASWQARASEAVVHPGMTAERAWLQVVEHSGEVARAIRGDRVGRLVGEDLLGQPVLSMLLFSSIVGFDIGEVTWSKFPAICPYCIGDEQPAGPRDLETLSKAPERPTRLVGGKGIVEECACPPPPKPVPFDPEAGYLDFFRGRVELKPTTVPQWQAMFYDVYVHRHHDLAAIAYHFIEEIGEVVTELRRQRWDECAFECADVFSWILSLANCAGEQIGGLPGAGPRSPIVSVESQMIRGFERWAEGSKWSE